MPAIIALVIIATPRELSNFSLLLRCRQVDHHRSTLRLVPEGSCQSSECYQCGYDRYPRAYPAALDEVPDPEEEQEWYDDYSRHPFLRTQCRGQLLSAKYCTSD